MDLCCRLGDEYFLKEKQNVVYESPNFFVVPTIGQMGRKGYLLICSKEHYLGVGGMPKELHGELEEVTSLTRSRLSEIYRSDVVVFEHGPRVCSHRGGGCLDHTHLHAVTVSANIIPLMLEKMANKLEIKEFFNLERVKGFDTLAEIYNGQETSYMFIELNDLKRFVTQVNFLLPSQYIRQIIALSEGRDDWNWHKYPGMELFDDTVRTLQDRF